MPAHGSGIICLRPSEMRIFSRSNLRICTSIESPTFTSSAGLTTRPQDISVTCSSPSTPQIHEDSVVGEVLHLAGDDGALGQSAHQRFALRFEVFFQQHAPADHHVSALADRKS